VYDTLGVCSSCEDVSSQLTYGCFNTTIDWAAEVNGGYNADAKFVKGAMCGYFLNATVPNQKPILMSGYLVKPDGSPGETLLTRSLPLTTIFDFNPFYGNGSIRFKDLRNTIADVLLVSSADGSAVAVHQKRPPIAQECVLSWCVKTMRSSYDQGQYTEEIIDTFQNKTQGPLPWVAFPFQTADQNGTDNFYLQNISIDLGSTPGGRNISGYGTSNYSASAINQGFRDIFPAFTTVSDKVSTPMMRFMTWQKGSPSTRLLNFNPWLAPNNVSRHMERLAEAMTNVVRSASSNEMLAGESFSKETYVDVRWEWLTLPLGLLGLSFVFLTATIFKSSIEKEQVGVLKNSAILTLLYGVSDEIRGKLTRSSSTGTPRHKAKELKVKLNPNMGWRVSGNLFSPLVSRPPPKQPPPGWI
jgi:hypothetical protein